jgi:eukaryotic-like serine/threonine-protein kinase
LRPEMAFISGTKLGPYEIQAALGAGGMGEVYRARDHRLGRDVAVKVLPATLSRDPDRLRRFEQEARATAALNHPNILAVHDVGTHEDSPFLVMELLAGDTLRQLIRSGSVPVRKATDYTLQLARGLAAAHEQGITHRDLKPENIFLTKDGRIKILDFGLAKLTQQEKSAPSPDTPTIAQTEPGIVLGTVGYMSPEQVRGQAADACSDIFSLGAILYEMITGERAFQGDTAAETMSAILKTEPPQLTELQPNVPPGLARIVEHCLEKDPSNRFQSARDVAFALEAFSGASSSAVHRPALPKTATKWQGRSLLLGLGAGLLIALAAFVVARKTSPPPPQPTFHALTFQRGTVQAARFAPDGETIIYAAAWAGKPIELFSTRPEGTESRALGLTDSDLLAVSSSGELAVRLHPQYSAPYANAGTMARAMLSGGSPRPMESDVEFADWAPDGNNLAIARRAAGKTRLEFPVGKPLYDTTGWIGNPRFSPRGDLIAFVDHPSRLGDPGRIAIVDLAGQKKILSQEFISAQGLAWSPRGDEVWFTATRTGGARALYGVSLAGKERLITRIPGILHLFDVSRRGRVLLARDDWRVGLIALPPGATHEEDLSWMDFSAIRDISADGKLLLFDESGEAGGQLGAIYLRKMDGSPPVRLGDGTSDSLSPDAKWVLAASSFDITPKLDLLPTGTGQPQSLSLGTTNYRWGNWLPNGHQIIFLGNEPNHGSRIYLLDIPPGQPRPITPEGLELVTYTHFVSPNGKLFLAVEADGTSSIRSTGTGDRQSIPGLEEGEVAFGWSGDGQGIYAYRPAVPAKVFEIELASGRRRLWKELNPSDPAGINFIRTPHISADGKAYAYNYNRILSDLYLVDGVK